MQDSFAATVNDTVASSDSATVNDTVANSDSATVNDKATVNSDKVVKSDSATVNSDSATVKSDLKALTIPKIRAMKIKARREMDALTGWKAKKAGGKDRLPRKDSTPKKIEDAEKEYNRVQQLYWDKMTELGNQAQAEAEKVLEDNDQATDLAKQLLVVMALSLIHI